MGIIKAIAGAVSGNLADQWLEVLEADNMTDTFPLDPSDTGFLGKIEYVGNTNLTLPHN